MAKKSIVLDNGDGRVTFSNTASVSIDDTTSNISASLLSANSINLNNIGVGVTRILSASNGVFNTFQTGTINGGAIAFDGNKWVASAIAPNDYIGTASGDLSGTFDGDVKLVNISNVSAGALPVAFGGSGKSLAAGQNYVLKISSSVGSTPSVSTLNVPSGNLLVTNSKIWTALPPGYPDVRFYTSGSSGNTFTWIKPTGAKFARIICQGAGGGGGGSGTNNVAIYNGAGGGAGAFADITVDVSAIQSASVVTGIGGLGGICGTSNAVMTAGNAGSITYFSASNIYVYSNPGAGGGEGSGNNNSIGGAGGTAMPVTYGGYSRNGGAGSTAGGTAGVADYTIYGACGGGGAGGWYDRGIVVPMISSTCFGYNVTTDGIDISSLNFVQGTDGNGNGSTNIRAGYGAGGAGRVYNAGIAGTLSDQGGHGYIIVISW